MRNRQAQYIPASGKQLGIIQPIDTKYAFMAQQQSGKNLIVKPLDRVENLTVQSAELNNKMSSLELGYQQLQEDMVNTVTSYGGGTDAFFTSNDPAVVNKRNEFYQRASALNNQRDFIYSAKNKLKQNAEQWATDNKTVPADQVSLTQKGVNIVMEEEVEVSDTKTGEKKKVKQQVVRNLTPDETLKLTSNRNPNKIKINANQIMNTGEYLNYTDNTLPMTQRDNSGQITGIQMYDRVIPINAKESEASFSKLFSDTGSFGVSIKDKKSGSIGSTQAGITITNANSNNMLNLLNVIQGATDPNNGLLNTDLNNYLYNEYITFLKDRNNVPWMKLKAKDKDGKELTDEKFKEVIAKGLNIQDYQFEVDYQKDDKGEIIYDKNGDISEEGYISFVINKAVKHANPQIDLIKQSGEEYVTQSTNAVYPEKEKVALGELEEIIAKAGSKYSGTRKTYANFDNPSMVAAFKNRRKGYFYNKLNTNDKATYDELLSSMVQHNVNALNIQKEWDAVPYDQKTPAKIEEFTNRLNKERGDIITNAIVMYDIGLRSVENETSPTIKKAMMKALKIDFNDMMFNHDVVDLGYGGEVKATALWYDLVQDQQLSDNAPIADTYMYNGLNLKGSYTNIQYSSYSPNAPRFDKQFTYTTMRGQKGSMYLGDISTFEQKRLFYKYSANPINEMNGQAIEMPLVLTKAQLKTEFGNKPIPLVNSEGGISQYTLDQVLNNADLAKQIGIDINPYANKNQYNPKGWEGSGMADYEKAGTQDIYVVKVLKYNFHNLPRTGGTEKPKSTTYTN